PIGANFDASGASPTQNPHPLTPFPGPGEGEGMRGRFVSPSLFSRRAGGRPGEEGRGDEGPWAGEPLRHVKLASMESGGEASERTAPQSPQPSKREEPVPLL